MTQSFLLIAHTGRSAARDAAAEAARRLRAADATVRVLASEAAALSIDDAVVVPADESAAAGVVAVLVLGGDGTLLRAAEIARPAGAALLGVNLGHVGFLAESEIDGLDVAVDHLLRGAVAVEQRMTSEVVVYHNGAVLDTGWALNEVAVEKAARERMVELVAEVDGRPLSRWGCDGIVIATPTGSTAYAFSAGGPVVAPDLELLLVVPISAHALFARPIAVAAESVVAVEVLASGGPAVLTCDGRRSVDLPPGARVEVRRGALPVRLVRLQPMSFIDRLVAKFDLPVAGWRGATRR
ncbi:MAG: NAD kinase [Mycobacteriales bacterium]|nr:NAD kinase [Frankia sp.]